MAKMDDHDRAMLVLRSQLARDLKRAEVEMQAGEAFAVQPLRDALDSMVAKAKKAGRTDCEIDAAINGEISKIAAELQKAASSEEQAAAEQAKRINSYAAAFKKHGVLLDGPVSEHDIIDAAVAAVMADRHAAPLKAQPPEPDLTAVDEGAREGEIPLKCLATPDELIHAFGLRTGMEKSWFRKPEGQLFAARKKMGRPGRNRTIEPLYCPYEILQWLMNPKRKKGKKLDRDAGWRMLEHKFPESYERNSHQDPR